jgi:hypothetical protein
MQGGLLMVLFVSNDMNIDWNNFVPIGFRGF